MDTGLRARKKRETRRRLIAAAIDLGERHGIDEVTVADIAAEAGVSRRTFFNYFSSREEALAGFDADRAADLAERLADRPADEPMWASIRAALADFYATTEAGTDRSWVARVRMARSHPSLAGALRTHFTELETTLATAVATRTGLSAQDMRPRLVAALAMATLRVAVDDWLRNDDDRTLAEAADAAMALVVDDVLVDDVVPATPAQDLQ